MSKRHPALFEVGIGLILTGFFAYSYLKGGTSVDTVSQKTYDLFAHLAGPAPTTDSVRIVGIDQASVESLGRWPWPRGLTGQLIDEIAADGAKVIGLNVFLVDPDRNEALEELGHLEERYKQILDQEKPALARKRIDTAAFEDFLNTDLANAKDGLNGDAALARSIEQAVNVVLPMYFVPGEALGKVPDLPEFFAKEKVALPSDASVPEAQGASLPLDSFANAALAIGHANLYPDSDGTLRRIPLLVRYGTNAFPSFALQIVREYLSLQRNALKFEPPATFQLNKARIPVDESGMAFVRFAGGAGTVKSFSALSVLDGSLPEKSLDGKIVLVGLTAPGAADGTVMVAPGGERITGLEILANHIENILTQTFISRPAWAGKAELGLLGAAALVVILILPFLRARFAVPIAALVFAGIAGSSWFLFVKRGMWVSPAHGASLLLAGFVVLIAKRLIFTEKGKEMVEAEGVETNKMLGLSFQGQGMLDLAFEKFRRIPLDAATKDLLYNLGLDMERKRMFAKAAAVYEHIATVDAKFKDIREKIEFLKKAGEGAVFGGIGKKGQDATVMVEGLGQSTTLGRYEVVKELGRGAMGIVYLGRDPKINRQVAIKTLRFEEAVDEEQVKAVKERFFREAESAGNLTHPNIIRIFDAGEDQDVAYIAMELIEGHDLKKYCEKTALLPIPRVLDIVAQVANGLEYAHAQGVVHRDIKPGNIMMIKDGTLRITDFGIARIQASSKTATGAVLGTPAYMSPEQVRGQKVDGRADIFSLGGPRIDIKTGEKPFQADSIATLLYQIANVEHGDPRLLHPGLPEEVVPIINKALAKKPEERYQHAGEMAADLEALRKKLGGAPAGVPSATPAPAAKAPAAPAMPAVPAAAAPAPVAPPPPPPAIKPQSALDELTSASLAPSPEPAAAKAPAPSAPKTPPPPPVSKETFERTVTAGDTPGAANPAFFSELQQTFNVISPTDTPAAPAEPKMAPILPPEPKAEPKHDAPPAGESPFRILQNNDPGQNFPEEDFLKALSATPDKPAADPSSTISIDPIIDAPQPPMPGALDDEPRKEQA